MRCRRQHGMLATSIAPACSSAAVGGEQLQQPVLDDDRKAEGDQQRRQQVVAQRAVEHEPLQRIADRRHQRHDDDERGSGSMPSVCVVDQREIGGEHDEVAMRDVDEPHHAEDQRQPGREHGVEPADQHALHDDVDPVGHGRRALPDAPTATSPCRPRARGDPYAVSTSMSHIRRHSNCPGYGSALRGDDRGEVFIPHTPK